MTSTLDVRKAIAVKRINDALGQNFVPHGGLSDQARLVIALEVIADAIEQSLIIDTVKITLNEVMAIDDISRRSIKAMLAFIDGDGKPDKRYTLKKILLIDDMSVRSIRAIVSYLDA